MYTVTITTRTNVTTHNLSYVSIVNRFCSWVKASKFSNARYNNSVPATGILFDNGKAEITVNDPCVVVDLYQLLRTESLLDKS